jgi:hypothetical protein
MQFLSKSQLIPCRSWQADPKIYMKIQGTQKSHNKLEKEQSQMIHTSKFQTYFQDTVVLAYKDM